MTMAQHVVQLVVVKVLGSNLGLIDIMTKDVKLQFITMPTAQLGLLTQRLCNYWFGCLVYVS